METAGLVALALTLGFVVGAGLATILVIAARSGRRMVAAQSAALPAGIEAVIEVLEIPAVLLDPSGTPVAASAGASDAGLIDGGVHPEVLAIADQVRAEGETVRRELALRRLGRPDQVRHLRMTAALVGARYVLLVADDRSESVRVEEMRRDFVANVSHELKTPIGAVSLLAEDPAQVRRFTARLGEEARRLAELTQDIIELSRAQGLEPLAGSDLVRVDEVVATAIEQNRVAAVAKGIEIASRRPKERLLVLGQDAMLVTAVANLIANAVQYSPERSRVAVGMARRGDDVEITVTDQGPGIPEEEQERVFERFFRSDPARSRNTGGTGLGLSLVKHAVAGHGGSIRVWSRPGSDRPPARGGAGRTGDARKGHRVTSILIVEDEAALAEPLEYLLSREGYETTTASDGVAALAAFDRSPPDLVLLDLMLPGIPGTEVCRRLRARSQTPIIMLTAKDAEIDVVLGLELGADDYVTKPYSSRELLARIRAVLRRRVEPDLDAGVLEAGPVRMDVDRHTVSVAGREIAMPLKEFELLELLLRNAGRVLTRGQLIDRVWGADYFGDTKTLDVHIKRIRAKIEETPSEPRLLMTVRGLGYRFDA